MTKNNKTLLKNQRTTRSNCVFKENLKIETLAKTQSTLRKQSTANILNLDLYATDEDNEVCQNSRVFIHLFGRHNFGTHFNKKIKHHREI